MSIADLRDTEARLRAVIDTAADGVVITDKRGKIQRLNAVTEGLFHYSPDELIGRRFVDLLQPPHRPAYAQYFTRSGTSAEVGDISARREATGRRKDGGDVPIRVSAGEARQGNQRLFVFVLRDLTERKDAERALKSARDEAEKTSKSKSRFLAHMSHELRTPLNAIIGFSQIIEKELFGEIKIRKYVEYGTDIRQSGEYILSLINDILDLSKIEAGKLDLRYEIIDTKAAALSAVRLIEQRARKAGLTLLIDIAEDLPALRTDARAFKQIFLNLLSNAVKFTPRGGTVSLQTSLDPTGGLNLMITDTGVGIPSYQIPRVLEPFEQAANHLYHFNEGTGLGLPLVKALVELQGGHFAIDSEVDNGTTVRVSLPSSRVLGPAHSALQKHEASYHGGIRKSRSDI